MTVEVFAFTSSGYQKKIAVLDEEQTRMTYAQVGIDDNDILEAGNRIGIGISIDPTNFDDVDKFVIKVFK